MGDRLFEKVEQLGLDFLKMFDQTYDDVNMAGKTNGVSALVQCNNIESGVDSHILNVCIVKCANFFILFPKWQGISKA